MKEIPGFEGYWASEEGLIYSARSGSLNVLASQPDNHGYQRVTLKGSTGRDRQPVHRLVLLAFAGLPKPGSVCRHMDGDKANNRPANLQWGTHAENAADAIRHGTLGHGMKARHRRLSAAQVLDIRLRAAAGEPSRSLANEFHVHPSYIPRLIRGRNWPAANEGEGGVKSSPPLAA